VPPGVVDLPRDLPLAADRVDRDGGAPEVDHRQQFGDGGDLVLLIEHAQLRQHQPVLGGERADDVRHRRARVPGVREAAPQALAVDRDQPAAAGDAQRVHPLPQHLLHLQRVQAGEHAAERVVRRDAARQREEPFEPRGPDLAEVGHVVPAVGPAQDRDQRHDDHLGQRVQPVVPPRVGDEAGQAQNGGGR